MKKTVYGMMSVLFAFTCFLASAQIQTPTASARASASTTVGLTDVKVDYFRPSVKGRKVFGAGSDFLVPYGELWRTGANTGTKITFSDDVKVAGTAVAKGEYLLLSIPDANEWTLILYKDPSIGGNMAGYDQSKDAVRVKAKANQLNQAVETFTVNITDISADNTKANIEVAWANVSVKLGFEVDFDEKVMKAIEAGTRVNPNNYIAAANYYFDNGKDLKKALEWITLGIETGNPNAFWNIHTKAKIQLAMGDHKGALATAQQSMEKAKAAGNDFGYVKLNEDLIAKINAEMPKTPAKKK